MPTARGPRVIPGSFGDVDIDADLSDGPVDAGNEAQPRWSPWDLPPAAGDAGSPAEQIAANRPAAAAPLGPGSQLVDLPTTSTASTTSSDMRTRYIPRSYGSGDGDVPADLPVPYYPIERRDEARPCWCPWHIHPPAGGSGSSGAAAAAGPLAPLGSGSHLTNLPTPSTTSTASTTSTDMNARYIPRSYGSGDGEVGVAEDVPYRPVQPRDEAEPRWSPWRDPPFAGDAGPLATRVAAGRPAPLGPATYFQLADLPSTSTDMRTRYIPGSYSGGDVDLDLDDDIDVPVEPVDPGEEAPPCWSPREDPPAYEDVEPSAGEVAAAQLAALLGSGNELEALLQSLRSAKWYAYAYWCTAFIAVTIFLKSLCGSPRHLGPTSEPLEMVWSNLTMGFFAILAIATAGPSRFPRRKPAGRSTPPAPVFDLLPPSPAWFDPGYIIPQTTAQVMVRTLVQGVGGAISSHEGVAVLATAALQTFVFIQIVLNIHFLQPTTQPSSSSSIWASSALVLSLTLSSAILSYLVDRGASALKYLLAALIPWSWLPNFRPSDLLDLRPKTYIIMILVVAIGVQGYMEHRQQEADRARRREQGLVGPPIVPANVPRRGPPWRFR